MDKARNVNTFSIDIFPVDDEQRVKALREYCLLEAPQDVYFENIVELAAAHFDVPIALISLVDRDEVYFKGNVGMKGVDRIARGISLCSLAILSPDPTIITDPLADTRLACNPLVHKEFALRFYAAAPLVTRNGYRIGAVTLVDKKARTFSGLQIEQLGRFAQMVMHDLDLRLSVKEKERQLEKEISRREKLVTKAVLAAQERERSKMGRDLHDNVNQILTTVKLYNEMALDPNVDSAAILTKSSNYLQECIDEIRAISRRLSATTIGDITLPESIRELINSLNGLGKIDLKLSCDLNNDLPVSQELHTTVYRIIQEGLNNIMKHARATNAEVKLLEGTNGLSIEISDDGVGFDVDTKKTGIGITNIKARAENHNGRLDIKSAKGEGCSLNIYLPYYLKN